MVRFSEMPGWTRQLMSERAFRKAAIRAAKMETVEIAARWDRGNAWSVWRRGSNKSWRHSTNGMHSQALVPVTVSGRTLVHAPRPDEWYDTKFRKEVSYISFWNWNDQEEEDYCPSLKGGKRCRKMGGTPCPYRPAAMGNYSIMECDANEAVEEVAP